MLVGKLLVTLGILVGATTAGTVALASTSGTGFDFGPRPQIEVSGGAGGFLPAFAMLPGDTVTSVRTVVFHGGHSPAALGIHVAGYASRAQGSDGYCTAADPAAKINLTVSEGATVAYQGTLADFARAHAGTETMLKLPGSWQPGQPQAITFRIGLDRSAGNAYQGCRTTADLAWEAA